MSIRKNSFLAVFTLFCACFDSVSDSVDRSPEPTEDFSSMKKSLESSNFRVFRIEDEDGAIRINLILPESVVSPMDIRRETINALLEIKTRLGDRRRVAVWSYGADKKTARGMAYYSPLTEQYHFKPAGELH